MKVKALITLLLLINFAGFSQSRDLHYFLNNATLNSPVLNELRNQAASFSIDSQILSASTKLQVTGNGGAYYAPVIRGYGFDDVITNGQQLSALVTVSKNLFPKNSLNLQFRDLQLSADSINIFSKISAQDLRKNVIAQYIQVYGEQLQLDFTEKIIKTLSTEDDILQKLTRSNVYKQVDYLSFKVTLQQQQLALEELRIQYQYDYGTLLYMSGIRDSVISQLADPEIKIEEIINPAISVFFMKYEIDSMKLANTRALINMGYKPRISVFADGGYQSSFTVKPYKNLGTGIGINVSIPIYDGHQKKLLFNKLNLQDRSRARNRDFFRDQYEQQIMLLTKQLVSTGKLKASINKQVLYLETLIEANLKLLQTGDIRMTDFVLTLNNYITAKNLTVQNIISRYQIVNQLNYWNR